MTALITLIPAYKAEHLGEVFAGLAAQTWRDFRVVLSDDSPGSMLTRLLREGAWHDALRHLDLTVVPGPRRGSMRNLQHLVAHWAGGAPLVHLMMDDDMLAAGFYRRHVEMHAAGDCGASVTRRLLVDGLGRVRSQFPIPEFVAACGPRVVRLDAPALAATTIPTCWNWLGEFSNTVYRSDAVRGILRPSLASLSYYGLGDIGLTLHAARQAPLAFVDEHLGGFRIHGDSSTTARASFGHRCGHLAWAALALDAWALGWIDVVQTTNAVSRIASQCRQGYADDALMQAFVQLVDAHGHSPQAFRPRFAAFWHRALKAHDDSALTVPDVPEPVAIPGAELDAAA